MFYFNIVYWIYFQNIHTFAYQKTFLYTLFWFRLKLSKAFSVSLSIFYKKQWRKAVRNKLRRKFGPFMQNKCSYIFLIWKKTTKVINQNSIPPFWVGPLVRVHLENFHLTLVGSWQNEVISHLGWLARFSYEHIIFL